MANIMDMIGDGVNLLNPISRSLDKKGKKIMKCLLANGFSKKDIINFTYAPERDVEEEYDKIMTKILRKAKEQHQASAEA